MLLEDMTGDHAAATVQGSDLGQLLTETSPFVLYLTDAAGAFLICHNDHNVLIVVDPDGLLTQPPAPLQDPT